LCGLNSYSIWVSFYVLPAFQSFHLYKGKPISNMTASNTTLTLGAQKGAKVTSCLQIEREKKIQNYFCHSMRIRIHFLLKSSSETVPLAINTSLNIFLRYESSCFSPLYFSLSCFCLFSSDLMTAIKSSSSCFFFWR